MIMPNGSIVSHWC